MSMSIKDYETITGKSVSQDIQCKGISDAYQSVINNFKLKKNVLRFCVRDSLQDKFGQSLFGKKFKPHCQMAFSSIWEVILSIERDPIADVQSIRSVQSLSRVQLFVTPWNVAHQASLSFTITQNLLKLMSIESMMPFNHLILYHPLDIDKCLLHSKTALDWEMYTYIHKTMITLQSVKIIPQYH